MINAQIDDHSSHNTKYTSPALTHKVFANMKRVGKGFLGVDIPLFAETRATLTKQVANLEQDKIAQAIEIIELKQRVKRRGGIAELDTDKDVTLEEVSAKETKDADLQGRLEESQAKVYHLDIEHAKKVLSMQETNETEPAEVEDVIEVVIDAKLMTEVVTTVSTPITVAPIPKASAPRKRRGVIIQDPKEAATASEIMQLEVKSKDKGNGILVEEPKPLKRQAQVEHDKAFVRELKVKLNANINWNYVVDQVKIKEMQYNTVMRYQALKREPVTEAQAKKNMMVYLKNMAGFKMDFFKEQMLNNVRLEVEEEHEMSLELLRLVNIKFRGGLLGLNNVLISLILRLFSFRVDDVEDFKENMLRYYYCWFWLKLLVNAADTS
nr:hypothetical protein [Tanacetum cinerariifolium]